jgi:hypothetical protein
MHGQRRQADEAPRRLLVRQRQLVVVEPAQLHAQFAAGPVRHRLRQRQRVRLDALRVHRLEARVQVHEFRPRRPGHHPAQAELRPLWRVAPFQAMRRTLAAEQIEEFPRVPVGVDVDGVHLGHARIVSYIARVPQRLNRRF